jgi:hypothetical protein
MDAFMNGFEFVLLAMRGRLAEGALPAAERERITSFLADYSRIASAYRQRKAGAPPALVLHGRVLPDLEERASN